MYKQAIYIVLTIGILIPCRGQLSINEFQASNINTILDPSGNYLEWIEIYNAGDTKVDLEGYYLTDDLNDPFKCRIGTISVYGKSHSILWLHRDGEFGYCQMKLDMEGEEIGLFDPSGQLIDSVRFKQQYLNVSQGRQPDGSGDWYYYDVPTPEAANSTESIKEARTTGDVKFSFAGGFYQGSLELCLSSESDTEQIRYTLDGSWPKRTSPIYSSTLIINQTTVVRARTFSNTFLPGSVITQTYILNDSNSLPVVSISSDPDHFFSNYTGIYVEGYRGIVGRCSDEPVNWNRDWERPVNFEYFTSDGTQKVNQQTGTKINGGCSRNCPFKSMAVIARNKYGNNRLNYKFFASREKDEFKSLVLRNSGNDSHGSMFRDGFMQSLLEGQMDIDLQAYQPAIFYLNGEYWGILNVREKINEHYPATNYNLDSEEIDMLEGKGSVVNGDGKHYEEMINYAINNDLSVAENFDYINSQMDVNEFLNYYIAEIYFENLDWPQNNIKYWRPHVEGGKWRWIMYDTDWGWGLYTGEENVITETIKEEKSGTQLIRSLIENENFYYEFLQRMAASINFVFNPDRVHPIYDSINAKINKEIDRHKVKWRRPLNWTNINQTTVVMPGFTDTRPNEMRTIMLDNFGLSGMYNLNIDVSDSTTGYIQTSDITVSKQSSGLFFKDIPLRLRAVPESGYTFSHWEGASNSDDEIISLNLSSDSNIRAVFKPDTPMDGIVINEICASNISGITDEYGQLADWIEIYNQNDFAVNLAGWYLSDSAGYEKKFRIPDGNPELTTVGANDFLLIWCDNETPQGPLHASFKLQKEGEVVSLVQQIEGSIHFVDSVRYPKLKSDLTYGRIQEPAAWEYLLPSPLALNEIGDPTELFINEMMTRNCGSIVDEFGESDDWIEIYNPTSDTLDLGGLFFTDSLQVPIKHRMSGGTLATKVPPYGYKVLWADNQPEQGVLHLGFKLDGKNEQIGIYKPGQGYLDSLSYNLDISGMAIGRYVDGSELIQPVTASPGFPNGINVVENIYINEFMARNSFSFADPFDEQDDWIEIYNHNEFPVDIGGLFITDSLADPAKCWIPTCQSDLTTIPAKSFIVLWADGQEEQGVLHLDMKLKGEGEAIGLVQADGLTFIDSISYRGVYEDMAIGRLEDGLGQMQIVSASPGSQNYIRSVDGLYISEFSASGNNSNPDKYGEFDDWIEIYNDNDFDMNIGGLFITDSLDHLSKFRISGLHPDSTTILAKDYLILWADNQPDQGINHLGFKLKGNGEQIALVNIDCIGIVDSVSYPNQYSNFSYSRMNNIGEWSFLRPTHQAYNMHVPVEGIFINEFMASNTSIKDEYGEYGDWIELYNANDFPVDIGGLYLTDSLGDPSKFRIPSHSPERTTLPSKGFFVLFADDDKEQGLNHTNFKLSRGGEAILLFQCDGSSVLDSIVYSEQYKNSALGRVSESGDWYTIPPTPGRSNLIPDLSDIVINEVMGNNRTLYSDEYNEYDDWIELYNSGNTPIDVGGLYLTDSLGNPTRCRISSEYPDSTTIQAKDYLILWADNTEEQGIRHLGFKVSKTGENICLFGHGQTLIDSTSYPFIGPNLSWGRTSDGHMIWTRFLDPTPLFSNSYTSVVQEKLNSNGISVYPNPVSDEASVEVFLNEPSDLIIEIIDQKGTICSSLKDFHYGNGKQIFIWKITNASGNSLTNGIYYLRILTKEGSLTKKIVVSEG